MPEHPLSVLLLCDDRPSHAPNVLEHIHALRRFSRHRVDGFNPRGVRHSRLLRLDDYDAVVVHYTIFALSDNYLAPSFRERLAAYDGLKVQFIQDEYRQVDAMTKRMTELGIDLLFSSVPADAVPDVYDSRLPGVDVLTTLTGYVPADLEPRRRPPLQGRSVDVVYRGRAIPYWLGRLGQEKVVIGREFLTRAASTGLRCDIAWTEGARIYGEEWYRFLGAARTTLGTESGASIVDFDGSLQMRTDAYLRDHPTATFEEVERALLEPYEGNAVIQAISPRVFEAAALGTAMINFAGRYSDVIEPWTHYIPLEKDFSNFAEVLAAVQDEAVLESIASRAHADLVDSGRYSLRRFVEGFDHELETRVRPAPRRPRPRAFRAASRSLLALERLATPARRADLPLVVSLRARSLERAERRLLRRFPSIEALARAQLGTPRYERVVHDLVRVAAAAAAHLRELRYLGPPFDVQLELGDEGRRLMLVGTRGAAQDASSRAFLRPQVASAIREGRLQEIVWNNSDIGGITFASVPLPSLEIGYHITPASHRFTALSELAGKDPDGVISALDPLFLDRPASPVHELGPRAVKLIQIGLRPGPPAARAAATARTVLASNELRHLLRAYLESPEARAEVSINLLLKDILRLRLVGEAHAALELDADRKRLIYRTNGDRRHEVAALDSATVRSLEQILWDNSAAGSSVTSKERPHVSLKLDDGTYEFEGLTAVARRFPELAAPALARAANPD